MYVCDDVYEFLCFCDWMLCYVWLDNLFVCVCECMLCDFECGSDCVLFLFGMVVVNVVFEGVVCGMLDVSLFVCSSSRGYFAVRARIWEWCVVWGVEVVEYDFDVLYVICDVDGYMLVRWDEDVKGMAYYAGRSLKRALEEEAARGWKVVLVWVEFLVNFMWDVMDLE